MKAMTTAGLDMVARRDAWRRGISVLACAGALLGASGVYAQEADSEAPSDADIVVTGTLLRGVAPVGTNVVAVSEADVIASGAASARAKPHAAKPCAAAAARIFPFKRRPSSFTPFLPDHAIAKIDALP